MADFRSEQEPQVNRFKDNTAGGKAAHDMIELDGFEPTTLQTEKESGGWLRTTIPEGAPLSSIHEIYTAGSRGAEGRLTQETVGRNKGGRDGTQGGDWDSGDGGDDGDDGGD